MEFDLILSLIFFAFCAGAIDAAVGGGGLIQIPALMGALPHYATATPRSHPHSPGGTSFSRSCPAAP